MSIRDLGTVNILGADAVGQPGQRRFRLFARTKAYSVILWTEKEQLVNLSLVIDRMLAQITSGRILRTEARAGGLSTTGKMPADFPITPDYELQIGQLRLNFESAREAFLLTAVPFDIADDEKNEPRILLHNDEELSLLFSIEQAQQLTSSITALVSKGRPVCPLCHMPLDGGPHSCVRQNGHQVIIQILVDEVEEGEDEEEDEEDF